MPTGYTDRIDKDPTMTASRWITEDLSRAFGVCYALRESQDMSADQMEQELEKDIVFSASYYRKELDETEKKLSKINKAPDTYFTTKCASTIREIKEYNIKSMQEACDTLTRHGAIKEELLTIRENTDDEITRNIAQFGLDQLELVKSQSVPYIRAIPTFVAFKTETMEHLQRDLAYHKKNIKQSETKAKERLLAYQKLRSEVYRLLDNKMEEK